MQSLKVTLKVNLLEAEKFAPVSLQLSKATLFHDVPDILHRLKLQEMKRQASKFTLPKMPALSNDGANIVLLDKKENVMDEFAYDPKMHSKFSNQDKGRSLERVSFDADVWASASDECGGATPGAKNSASSAKTEEINCVQSYITSDFPEIIIEYSFSKPNFKGTLLCFDRYGNPICTVYDYQLMDREGEWRWNGSDDNGNLLPTGIYVLVFEAVAEDGGRIRKKIVCTIGER